MFLRIFFTMFSTKERNNYEETLISPYSMENPIFHSLQNWKVLKGIKF